MRNLKRLLLAGTVVPALTFAPFAPASAQAPDNERHGATGAAPQQHEAAPHAGNAPPRAAAPAAHEDAHAREPARSPAADRAGANGRPGGGAAERRGPAASEHAREPAGATERRAPATPTHQPTPAREAPVHEAPARETPTRETPAREAPGHETPSRQAPRGEDAVRKNAPPAPRAGDVGHPGTPSVRSGADGRPATQPARGGDATPPNARGAGEAARPVPPQKEGGAPARPGRAEGVPHAAPPPGAPTRAGEAPRPEAPRPGAASAPDAQARHPGQPPTPSAGPQTAAPNRPGPDGAPYGGGQARRGISPGGAAAIGAAAGFAGGFLAATGAQHLDDIRRDRQEVTEDGRTFIREPGRTIVEENGRAFIVHDEGERFRDLGYEVHRERSGRDTIDVIDRPGGVRILTFTDPDGRMIRRVRRYPDGHEVVLIDNGYDGRVRPPEDDVVDLPPPPVDIPHNRYIVDYADADENVIYDTFEAPPLQAPPQRYTLDQIRYSPDIRRYVRAVDINTINFDTGSWVVPASASSKLRALGTAIKRAVDRNPNAVFLVEGFTDATGNPTDNLSLSDRRAQSVATILSRDFGVPPENLTTQGYGQQNLKVNTQGSSAANRRVVVQNITSLLAAGGAPPR